MSAALFRRPAAPANLAPSRANSTETFLLAVARLQNTLDAENAQISRRAPIDFHEFNLRKSQGLLELTRLMPIVAAAAPCPDVSAALAGLRAKLEDNCRALKVQLKAVQQVSDIIARTIQAGQSDGTYSAHAWRE